VIWRVYKAAANGEIESVITVYLLKNGYAWNRTFKIGIEIDRVTRDNNKEQDVAGVEWPSCDVIDSSIVMFTYHQIKFLMIHEQYNSCHKSSKTGLNIVVFKQTLLLQLTYIWRCMDPPRSRWEHKLVPSCSVLDDNTTIVPMIWTMYFTSIWK